MHFHDEGDDHDHDDDGNNNNNSRAESPCVRVPTQVGAFTEVGVRLGGISAAAYTDASFFPPPALRFSSSPRASCAALDSPRLVRKSTNSTVERSAYRSVRGCAP